MLLLQYVWHQPRAKNPILDPLAELLPRAVAAALKDFLRRSAGDACRSPSRCVKSTPTTHQLYIAY